jgi:hypothetical protein
LRFQRGYIHICTAQCTAYNLLAMRHCNKSCAALPTHFSFSYYAYSLWAIHTIHLNDVCSSSPACVTYIPQIYTILHGRIARGSG